jgi:hypothetical protein
LPEAFILSCEFALSAIRFHHYAADRARSVEIPFLAKLFRFRRLFDFALHGEGISERISKQQQQARLCNEIKTSSGTAIYL